MHDGYRNACSSKCAHVCPEVPESAELAQETAKHDPSAHPAVSDLEPQVSDFNLQVELPPIKSSVLRDSDSPQGNDLAHYPDTVGSDEYASRLQHHRQQMNA